VTTEERRQIVIKAMRDGNVIMKPSVVAKIVDAWENDIAEVWETAVQTGREAASLPLWVN
jgi:hypothetical protein